MEAGRSRSVSRAIYGQVLVTALVAAYSEDDSLDSLAILGAVLASMAVFWIAHVYAAAMERRMLSGRPLTWPEFRELALDEWPLVQSAGIVVLALALGAVGLLSTTHAVNLAIVLSIASLLAWAVAIGRMTQASWARTLLGAGINLLLGVAIIGLKIAVH